MLTDFQKFWTAGKRMKKIATKLIWHCPPHLKNVATLSWKIKNSDFLQIFSRYGRKCKQVAFLSPLALLLIHKFLVFKYSKFSPYWLQIKFSMSLFFYLFTLAINLEICHSRCHCSVCQWSTWYSATRTRLWQKHINTHIIHSYTCRGIEISALKMQFVCIFYFSSISGIIAEYLRFVHLRQTYGVLKAAYYYYYFYYYYYYLQKNWFLYFSR